LWGKSPTNSSSSRISSTCDLSMLLRVKWRMGS
jgi:hypothetical protein